MLRATNNIDKLLGTHAVQAWTTLDKALQDYTNATTIPTIPTLATTNKKTITPSFKALAKFLPRVNSCMRRQVYDELLITLDDIVYYLGNRKSLMNFNDERKCGKTPTTPRSIPPAEHVFDTLSAFKATVVSFFFWHGCESILLCKMSVAKGNEKEEHTTQHRVFGGVWLV